MATPYEVYLCNEARIFADQHPQYNNYRDNIAMILEIDCRRRIPEAYDVMSLTGRTKFDEETFKVAALIVMWRVWKM